MNRHTCRRLNATVLAATAVLIFTVADALAQAGSIDWRVCLKAPSGKYLDIKAGETHIYARLDKCTGNAVFIVRDLNGGVLTGTDRVRIGLAGLSRRWSTNTSNGELVQYVRDNTVGGNEYYNLHRVDRKKRAVSSGDKVALGGYTGWVRDSGGRNKLMATGKSIGAGETFILEFAPAQTADIAAKHRHAKDVAARPVPAKLPPPSGGREIHHGNVIQLQEGQGWGKLQTNGAGRMRIGGVTSQKKDRLPYKSLRIATPEGATNGQVVKLRQGVSFRIAGLERWLEASDKADDGKLLYRYTKVYEVQNLNQTEVGSAKGLNDVLVLRPSVPSGWVWIGDSIMRYDGVGANRVLESTSIIFKDNGEVFRKPPSFQFLWAPTSGYSGSPPSLVQARVHGAPFNVRVGGNFHTRWCCTGLDRARLIHNKYAMGLPWRRWESVANMQFTTRGQNFKRGDGGAAVLYNAAAYTKLADKKALAFMWAKGYAEPPDYLGGFNNPAPHFFNERFWREFSYYAEPRELRARPGANRGKAPANRRRAEIVLENAELQGDDGTLLDGMEVVLRHPLSGGYLERRNGLGFFTAGFANALRFTIFKVKDPDDTSDDTPRHAGGGGEEGHPLPPSAGGPAR